MLQAAVAGEHGAVDQLMEKVYPEFHQLARRRLADEASNHTLQATALVNEVYLKLVDQKRVDWRGKGHFFAIGAQAMRRILVDHARGKKRIKRGGGKARRVDLDDNLVVGEGNEDQVLVVHEALERLARLDPRQAKVVELRFFGGLSVAEAAEVLKVSKRTVEADWTMAKAWLRREFDGEAGENA